MTEAEAALAKFEDHLRKNGWKSVGEGNPPKSTTLEIQRVLVYCPDKYKGREDDRLEHCISFGWYHEKLFWTVEHSSGYEPTMWIEVPGVIYR